MFIRKTKNGEYIIMSWKLATIAGIGGGLCHYFNAQTGDPVTDIAVGFGTGVATKVTSVIAGMLIDESDSAKEVSKNADWGLSDLTSGKTYAKATATLILAGIIAFGGGAGGYFGTSKLVDKPKPETDKIENVTPTTQPG